MKESLLTGVAIVVAKCSIITFVSENYHQLTHFLVRKFFDKFSKL